MNMKKISNNFKIFVASLTHKSTLALVCANDTNLIVRFSSGLRAFISEQTELYSIVSTVRYSSILIQNILC